MSFGALPRVFGGGGGGDTTNDNGVAADLARFLVLSHDRLVSTIVTADGKEHRNGDGIVSASLKRPTVEYKKEKEKPKRQHVRAMRTASVARQMMTEPVPLRPRPARSLSPGARHRPAAGLTVRPIRAVRTKGASKAGPEPSNIKL